MINEVSWEHLQFLFEAGRWTVVLSLIVFVTGGIAGFIVALLRTARTPALRYLSVAYIQLVQGTPVLIVLFLSYYGLGIFGLKLDPMLAAAVAMTVYCSAYLGEIWRGCIEAVAKQQWEASGALAMNRYQQLRYVVLPQALRHSLPPTVGFMVQIVKNTSVTSIIGVVELTRAGQLISNATFQPMIVFPAVAILYFALCYPLSRYSHSLERKFHAHR
ncbi:MAG: amino acid ABC transporter permease [Pseudomonadota bacterium]